MFEPFTRWCAKGIAGVPMELGVPVCVVEDEHQLILNHRIIQELHRDPEVRKQIRMETAASSRWFRYAETSAEAGGPSGAPDLGVRAVQLFRAFRVEARRRHPAVESAIQRCRYWRRTYIQ